jgi:hypothetical protein
VLSISILKRDEESSLSVEGKMVVLVVMHPPALWTRSGSGKASGIEMHCSRVFSMG